MNERHELVSAINNLKDNIDNYWQQELNGWDNLLYHTIEKFSVNRRISNLLIQYSDLSDFSNELIAFAAYYKATWVLWQWNIIRYGKPSWNQTAFTDFSALKEFMNKNKVHRILISALDDSKAATSHSVKNPIVLQEIISLLEYFYEIHWPKKQAEYALYESIYHTIHKVFPTKQNLRQRINRDFINLARFLRNETYFKDETKNEVYRFISAFCNELDITSPPENFDDLKKYVSI